MIPIRESAGACSFAVRVHPRAKKDGVTGAVGDAIKLALTAPPVEGKANQACIEVLAKLLGVSRSAVEIATGETSRSKVVRVRGLTAGEIRQRLGL